MTNSMRYKTAQERSHRRPHPRGEEVSGGEEMSKCRCRFRADGVVLDERGEKVVRRIVCDIDQYDEDIGCNRNCHGYSVAKAVRESEEKK